MHKTRPATQSAEQRLSKCRSIIEPELHHVAALHDVLLALDAGLALGARLGDRAGVDQVVVGDDIGLRGRTRINYGALNYSPAPATRQVGSFGSLSFC